MNRFSTFLFLSLCPLQISQAPDLAATVAGLQRRYSAAQSIAARFTQTYRAPGIEQVESGQLYMKKPGRMCWEYRTPETKLFVADGRNTYLYVPGDRQVMVRPFSAAEVRNTPIEFLLGQGDISKTFHASWETEQKAQTEKGLLMRLTPRSENGEYQYLIAECAPVTFELRRLVIRELLGNTSEFALADLVMNPKIDAKKFEFKIPRGVEVVRIDDEQ